MRECAQYVAQMPLNEQGIARLKRMGIKTDSKDVTALMGLVYGQFASAINGNKNSADFIKDLLDKNVIDEGGASSFVDALNDKAEGICEKADDVVEE